MLTISIIIPQKGPTTAIAFVAIRTTGFCRIFIRGLFLAFATFSKVSAVAFVMRLPRANRLFTVPFNPPERTSLSIVDVT